MKVRLEKKNQKTVDFVELETKEHLLVVISGKVNKSKSSITKHCGTAENAAINMRELILEYESKNFQQVKNHISSEFNGVYDKAKWHFGGDFPKELDDFQGYVHTGMYLTWLIQNDLISTYLKGEFRNATKNVLNKQITGPQFYFEYLDGVLEIDDLSKIGNEFSIQYFDFDKGEFPNDYVDVLARDLPTIYHVEDSWKNYEKLHQVIAKRFENWLKQ